MNGIAKRVERLEASNGNDDESVLRLFGSMFIIISASGSSRKEHGFNEPNLAPNEVISAQEPSMWSGHQITALLKAIDGKTKSI